MIRQSLEFDDILEKKFKILRTSIMLGNLRNREDTLREYEDTAREIDKIRKNVYEELLASKLYTTITLEEEETRLKDLITFIENRIQERNDFVDDYIKITSNFLDGLDKVSLENELDNYKNRYSNIEEYLKNCEQIESLNNRLKELRDGLEEKYENKANNEIVNSKLEEELIDEFNKYISNYEYYSELNYTDIDLELTKIEESLLEKKSVLDTFLSSYQALVNAGISGAEREEYASYVSEARVNYYEDLEKKYILNIYKLVLDKQTDYERLYDKRSRIDSILNEREEMRNSLDISRRDDFKYFVTLCNEQFSIIKSQKFNMESIDKLILEISECENKLTELMETNNRTEIQDILTEFSVDAPEIEKIELPDEKEVYEEVIKDLEKKPDNMVVRIRDPIKINVKGVTDTAKLVMKKVVIVLEPKKFNQKRNKLKEAELELEEEKKNIEESILEDNLVTEKVNENIDNQIDSVEEIDKEEIDTENLFEDEIKIDTSGNTEDIFLDDGIGIELDTKEVFDNDVTETKELTEIKINADDISNMTIPTEIYVEEPPVEPEPDLFTVTDPFLDDNEFEVAHDKVSEGIKANMPTLGNIGTVRPTNVLSKIEDVVRNNDDIILPNLGLVDNTKQEVPIVSENYIN
ncbi:MAG: hypothetical protein IJE89_03495 [Bacilli bacterium]|nr:hypothetical protein [Bacilli bacterium]